MVMDATWFGIDLWLFRHIDDWLASSATHAQIASSRICEVGPPPDVAEAISRIAAKAPEGFRFVLCNPSRETAELTRAALSEANAVECVIVRINADWSTMEKISRHAAAVGEGMNRAAVETEAGMEADVSLDCLLWDGEQADT